MNPLAYSQAAVAALMVISPASYAVVEQIGGITTGAAISQIFTGLDGVIDSARDAGDYLTMRAAMEMKVAIEAWKEANKELLDEAFSKLDNSQQQMFNNARQLADQVNIDAADRLEQAQLLTNQANQIVESIPLATKNTYVTKYSPRVKPAQTSTFVTLRVNGVNLDKGDPNIKLSNGNAIRQLIGPMEVQYTVPATELQGDPDQLSSIPLTISYSTPRDGYLNRLFGRRETVERQLPIVALPTNIGSYTLTLVKKEEQKEVEVYRSQSQKFRGKNTNKINIAKPKEGWQWDLSEGLAQFKQHGDGGEAGSCNGIDLNKSTKDGIVHSAHLDEIKKIGIPTVWGPGWQNCYIRGPVYRMSQMAVTLPTQSGKLNWTEDQIFDLPENLLAVKLEITTYDGRKRVFDGTGHDKFFDVVKGPSSLTIRPKQPTDI